MEAPVIRCDTFRETLFSSYCNCFPLYDFRRVPVSSLHAELQDTDCQAWRHVVERVARAARDRTADFDPLDGLTDAERNQIVTLPTSIEDLVDVRILRLYSSCLARLPTEICGMRSLECLDVYGSYRLHYFPYEIVRCEGLRDSRVSTRASYGNKNTQRLFPDLLDPSNAAALTALAPATCSICSCSLDHGFLPRWTTREVGTDWMPLLVFACSSRCIDAVPQPTGPFVKHPHTGGGHWTAHTTATPPNSGLQQTPPSRSLGRRS